MDEPAPPPFTRDRWALVGFGVPTVIALVGGLWGMLTVDAAASSGYQGLAWIFAMVAWGPMTLLWIGVGWLAARRTDAPGATRRFAKGAGVGLAASWILLAVTCFGSY